MVTRWAPLALALVLSVGIVGSAEAASCRQGGVASAPFIGPADMRAIDAAAPRLPEVRHGRFHPSIGAHMPPGLTRARLPAAVAKVLPQYAVGDYSAFRADGRLAIVDSRGLLVYLMPLGASPAPRDCP